MSSVMVRVENVSKRYKLGSRANHHDTFRDQIAHGVRKLLSANGRGKEAADEDFIWALKDISFEIEHGEIVGFMGRNGAGKSTLLKVLSRITDPTKGRVELHGRVGSLLEVGTGFHPELSGRENIYLNGAILGMRKVEIDRKFDEIVAFAEVEKFIDTPVKRYSSGMYVRLAFAVAAHLETEILIVDEVLAVGDMQFQKKCLGKMDDVAKQGRTVLFVSHNIHAIRSLCTRGVVIVDGCLRFDAPAVKALDEYCKGHDSGGVGRSWNRPSTKPIKGMVFKAIRIELEGQQPNVTLICYVELYAGETVPEAFIAVDISDQFQTPIMQALPKAEPFIPGRPGAHRLVLQIELPPMIPGTYFLDFWIGSHYSSTMDYPKKAVSFEITESPSVDRSYPHTPDHGALVPPSRCTYIDEDTALVCQRR